MPSKPEPEFVVEKRRPKPDCCELCQRDTKLTFHHLIPQKVHRRRRLRKRFDRQTMRFHGIYVCGLCHTAIHKFISSEQKLADNFFTIESLRAHPMLARHIVWAARQRC